MSPRTITEIRVLHAGAVRWEQECQPNPLHHPDEWIPVAAVEMVGTLLTELDTVNGTANKYAGIVEILSEALAIEARHNPNRRTRSLIAQALHNIEDRTT